MKHHIACRYLIVLSLLIVVKCKNSETASNEDLQKALSTFTLADGFNIELVAAEPLVSDPVAMEVDELGNIYVVEMHGYPLDKSGSGLVKLLTDSNGDGFPDKSAVFADSLVLPTGVMRWKKGVIVTDPPDLWYFEDTNHDGRADVKQKMLTGFALSNPQHNANTPVFGLDNWIYIAHQGEVTPQVYKDEFGDAGSLIRFPGDPSAPTLPKNADGRSIRFKPDTREIEMLSGESQYGQAFDKWGHHLGTSNANHLFQEVIAARYLDRNPNLRLANSIQMLPDHGDAAEVYPTTLNPEHQLLTDVGVITSSCGVTWYNGGIFPELFNQVTFIAEPVHNLVHADRISDNGATFTASRVYERKEFLTSTDAWFRPVFFYIGPDGALYILDYYRQIIEHPEWMSEEAAKSGALYNGSDKGRIYRIAPIGTPPVVWANNINLATASTSELVKQLANPNMWWRRNAQRLLLDRRDRSAISLLKEFADTVSFPPGIVHALWTLEGLQATDPLRIQKALENKEPGVRENAIRIAELHLSDMQGLASNLLKLEDDSDAKVRFQLLCTLGFLKDRNSVEARQKILRRDIEDNWVQVAALTSAAGSELAMIKDAIKTLSDKETEGRATFFANCASVAALTGNVDDIKKIIDYAMQGQKDSNGWWQAALLNGLTKAMREIRVSSSLPEERNKLLTAFSPKASPLVRRSSLKLLQSFHGDSQQLKPDLIAKAKYIVSDSTKPIAYREDALLLLSLDKKAVDTEMVEQLIRPTEPESLQKLAIQVYNSSDSLKASAYLISRWKTLTPQVRDKAMDAFMRSDGGMDLLLDAVKNGQVQPPTIGWPRMVELMNNENVEIRNRARVLLSGGLIDRDQVIERYQPALTMSGIMGKGEAVFKKNCAICHQVNGANGVAFGPDLASIRNREAQFIMADILHPNRSIADGYELWKVKRTNGEELTGIISSETSATLTIRFPNGEDVTIPRSELSSIEAMENSAMPVGLENSVSVEDMADLLAYLKRI
jgi:putative membrane-bound dehydrogenase-like protein